MHGASKQPIIKAIRLHQGSPLPESALGFIPQDGQDRFRAKPSPKPPPPHTHSCASPSQSRVPRVSQLQSHLRGGTKRATEEWRGIQTSFEQGCSRAEFSGLPPAADSFSTHIFRPWGVCVCVPRPFFIFWLRPRRHPSPLSSGLLNLTSCLPPYLNESLPPSFHEERKGVA